MSSQDQYQGDDGGSLEQKRDQEDLEEMQAAERDLASDAAWKKIQQNTFTRWCNEHLKTVKKHIGNLSTDLSDGLRLVALLEVLAHEKISHNKRPTFLSMKLENVSIALNYLEKRNIKIVNIGKFIQLCRGAINVKELRTSIKR